MTRRSTTWLVLAVGFVAVNIGGLFMAVSMDEAAHAAVHALLLLPGLYALQRVRAARREQRHDLADGSSGSFPADPFDNRLAHLEESMDAVAIEVERLGEGQRFMTRLFADDAARRVGAEPADGSGTQGHG